MDVALGHGEHQASTTTGVARVRGERHEVQVDAYRAHDHHPPSRRVARLGHAGRGFLHVAARDGRFDGHEGAHPDQGGLAAQPVTQESLRGESIEGVRRRAHLSVRGDAGHHGLEGGDRRDVAVEQLEGLAVVGAHADFEADHLEVRVDDGAAHLQPRHLAGEDTVLHDGLGATGGDQTSQGRDTGIELRGNGAGLGLRSDEMRPLDLPNPRRVPEVRRPPRQQAGVALGEEGKLGCSGLACPGHGPAKRSRRIVLGEHPGRRAPHHGGAGTEGPEDGRRLVGAVRVGFHGTDQRAKLGLQQRAAALRVERHPLGVALPTVLRWP